MKDLLKWLSYIDAVLGTIGTFLLAKDLGDGRYYRDWGLTISTFCAGIFSVLVLYAILRGISILLEKMESIEWAIKSGAEQRPDAVVSTGADSSIIGDWTKPVYTTPIDGWRCPKCGARNPDYVGTCGCGTKKP